MAMPGLDASLLEQHKETYNYGSEIIRLRKQQPAGIQTKPPVWTPYRNFLPEALDYVTKGEENECIQDGYVVSCIADNDCGTRTYLDSEVVVFQIAAGLNFRQRNFESRRENIWRAFKKTQESGTSLVVILGRNFSSWTINLPAGANHAVLDHFRIAHLWQEKDDIGNNVYMVQLQKHDLASQSWWTPNQPYPPANRVTLRPQGVPSMGGMDCLQCGHQSPCVYADNWMCLTPTCEFFWTPAPTASVARHSTFHQQAIDEVRPQSYEFNEEFLRYRGNFDNAPTPTYALVPALLPYLERMNGPQPSRMRMFYKGLICHQCSNIVPKVLWHYWQCNECKWKYDTGNTRIDLSTLVSRHFVSFSGHPPFGPEHEDGSGSAVSIPQPTGPSQRRPMYQIDKWEDLGAGCRLIVLSPTNNFNVQKDGPDAIYYRMLEEANVGELSLHRVKDSVTPTMDNHFHETYGAEYGFNADHPSKSLETAPGSIPMAKDFIDRLGRWELKSKYSGSNSVQALAYMEGMKIDWHVDGEKELGSTTSTLSLGGDATFHLRMRPKHYEETGMDAIHGAKHYEAIQRIRDRMRDGEDLDVDLERVVPASYRRSRRPELKVPLIHGSVVIMQGDCFCEYYEHKVEPKGPLRFAITTRLIDEEFREACMLKSKRTNGQFFTEEVDDHEPYGDYSERSRLASRIGPAMQIAGRKRPLPYWYDKSEREQRTSTMASDTDSRPTLSEASSRLYRRTPSSMRPTADYGREDQESISTADTPIKTPRPLPSATSAWRRTPGRNVDGVYWTDERYDRLLYHRDELKMGFDEISRLDLFQGQTGGALRTAATRARNMLRKQGHNIPKPSHHIITPQSDQSTPLNGSPSPVPGSRGGRQMIPGDFGEIWTLGEEDELWRLRHLENPPTYPEIAESWGHRRTPKAFREKFNMLKKKERMRKEKGIPARERRSEVEIVDSGRKRRKTGEVGAGDRNFEDVGGPIVLEAAVLQQPERPVQTRRGSKIGQAASGAREGAVVPSVEGGSKQQVEGGLRRSGRSK